MRRILSAMSLLLIIACAGILAGCGTGATSTSNEQPRLSLRFTDGAGNMVTLSEGTTKLTAGTTLKAIATWSPQPLPIEVTIKVTETENTPGGGLSISNDVKGVMPTLSTIVAAGKAYTATATAQQGAFKWNAGEYIFICNPKPPIGTALTTVFDTTVGDMAQVMPDRTRHFSITGAHYFRIGFGTSWYHIKTEWDVPGERNALAKTADGFYAAANGEGTLHVIVTNLDTGETIEETTTYTVTGLPDDPGMGFSR